MQDRSVSSSIHSGGANTTADAATLAERIIRWQGLHGRHGLPWQGSRDPYRVWLSEIMLQQTQVQTVVPYFHRFLARFPDVQALAAASEDEVLGLWSGLGYYSRARNLHRTAKRVVQRHGGRFPRRAADLVELPGIGPSTAAAVAAFCFGERVSIFDGNVRRVFSRYWGVAEDLGRAAPARALLQRAESELPRRDLMHRMPAYTQGLMDLGATVCTSRAPHCDLCPLRADCMAHAQGQPERYPLRRKRPPRPQVSLWLLHAQRVDGAVLLEQRPARGVWARLYCLPVFASRQALEQALPPQMRASARWQPPLDHALTHRQLRLHICSVRLQGQELALPHARWLAAGRWPELGLPAPLRTFLQQQAARPPAAKVRGDPAA